MKRIIVTLVLLLIAGTPALASDFSFSKGAGGASWNDTPETLTSLNLAKTGEENGAVIYRAAEDGGQLDGLPIIGREYAFTGGKLTLITLYFNAWHVDDAMKLAKKNMGEALEENALFARFETNSAVVTLLKKKAALTISLKEKPAAPAGDQTAAANPPTGGQPPVANTPAGDQQPAANTAVGDQTPAANTPAGGQPAATNPPAGDNTTAAGIPADSKTASETGGETKPEGNPEPQPAVQPIAKPKPAKDAELLSQTKLLAYSLNMILDKMDTLETDSAGNRISFGSYSDAYGKLAKESEALTSRYPKADIKLQEFAVVLNSLVSDLTFLTQKILSVQTDASLSGSLLNSAVSGATGNYLGVINSITSYFGSSKNEEKIKNDIVALRKRFSATREEYAKKLQETRSHVKTEYDITF
jgi:hypothetical protein